MGTSMLWIIAHTEIFFPLLLGALILIVELGFRLRQVSTNIDAERQSLIESARDQLIVLLGLLLGFSLPMALPHFEHRNELMVDEAMRSRRLRSVPNCYRNRSAERYFSPCRNMLMPAPTLTELNPMSR